jgi:hypothetical protein
MSRNYFSLPQLNPGNQAVDFAPIGNALETYRQQNNQNALMQQRQEEQSYQRGRDQVADQRTAKVDARQEVEWFGKTAAAIDRITDPAQRSMAWQSALKRHPNPSGLTPEYLDPNNGPKMVMAEAGQWRDPREDQLMDLKVRQAEKTLATPDGGTVQPTSVIQNYNFRNSLKTDEERKQFDDLVRRQNMLAGDTLIDGRTGAPVANVGDAIARGETAKVVGREAGEKQAAFPKVERGFKAAQIDDRNLLRSIDKAEKLAGPWTTGFAGSVGQYVKGSTASDLAITLRQVYAAMGFGALQTMRDNSPTGGALGAITEREIQLLQSAQVAIDQAQSEQEFREALSYIREIKTEYADLRRQAYEEDKARFGAANVPNPETGAAPGARPNAAPSAKDLSDDDILRRLGGS